jgi:hypothetical protein
MAGYYDETTGEYIDDGSGYGYNPLDNTSGTGTVSNSSMGYSDTGEEAQDWQNTDNSGTADMSGWKFSDGVWSDPSGKTYNMRYLTPNEQLSLGGQLSKLGQIAAQKLVSTFTQPNGGTDWRSVAAAAGGLYGLYQSQKTPEKTGYQGGIPQYEAVREQVPNTYDPDRRPGSGGQKYFTDTKYVAPADAASARTTAKTEAAGLEAANKANPARQERHVLQAGAEKGEAKKTETKPASSVIKDLPVQKYASGGIADMAKGRYLSGATDGMADKIPARIGGKQEAKLSHGEFVIPADVVGHLGNGNSEAGAQRLYAMMDRIRKARTGTTKQGRQINPDKFLA